MNKLLDPATPQREKDKLNLIFHLMAGVTRDDLSEYEKELYTEMEAEAQESKG